jgi:hypothetical protein
VGVVVGAAVVDIGAVVFVVGAAVVVGGFVVLVVVVVVVGTAVVVGAAVVLGGQGVHLICPGAVISGNVRHCPAPPSFPSYCPRPSAAFVTGSRTQPDVHPDEQANTSKLFGNVKLHENLKKKDPLANSTQ